MNGWLRRFLSQRSSAYRNFQIVFTVLTLNFAIPALSYVVQPEVAMDQLARINQLLGGAPYTFPEAQSRVWRYLGAANVMALALMCFLMQLDLRRFRVLLLPLCFLKAYNATLFLFGYFAAPQFPMLLAVALFDYLTTTAFLYFARGASKSINALPDDDLVPRPWFSG